MNAETWLVIGYIVVGLLGLASLWVLFRTKANSWRMVSISGLISTFLWFNISVFKINEPTVMLILALLASFLLAIGIFMSGSKH